MRYNNRLFPHPVLGVEDDVMGEFSCDLIYKSDKDTISIFPTFKLIEDSLLTLLSEEKVYFVSQVYCRSTMYREVFRSSKMVPDPIKISAIKLKGDVEVDFFICAETDIQTYHSEKFNQEYNKLSFSIDRSDILAYGGKGKFFANKAPEELKSVSSLIRVRNSEKKSTPMYNEYESEKIEIFLCEEDYESYQIILKDKLIRRLIHSSIVLPALVDALHFLDKKEAEDYSLKRWYKALMDIKEKSKTKDNFRIAQNILDLPNERMFSTLLNFMGEV